MVHKLFENISDDDLLEAVMEYKELSKTGILKNGILKKYSHKIDDVFKCGMFESLHITKTLILETAAYRWVSSIKFTADW